MERRVAAHATSVVSATRVTLPTCDTRKPWLDAELPATSECRNLTCSRGCQLFLCHNATHGILGLKFGKARGFGRRSVLLRIGGPHPQTTLFAELTPTESLASFRLCTPGNYTLHVRKITDNATDAFTRLKRTVAHRRFCPEHWQPGSILLQRHALWAGGANATMASCGACLWAWSDGNDAHEARESLSNVSMALHPWAASLELRFRALRWQPPWPRRVRTRRECAAAASHRAVNGAPSSSPSAAPSLLCLMGDSHLRNLVNTLVNLERPGRCNIRTAQKFHTTCSSASFQYVEMNSLSKLPLSSDPHAPSSWRFPSRGTDGNIERLLRQQPLRRGTNATVVVGRCTSVVVNFAHWPLSFNIPHAWPLSLYASEVDKAMRWLAHWSRSASVSVPLAWVAPTPLPLNGGGSEHFASYPNAMYSQAACPVRDQRLPQALQAVNDAAGEAAARHDLPYLDTWQQSLDLLELSFDMKHYSRPVDVSLAEAVLEWWHRAASPRLPGCLAAW